MDGLKKPYECRHKNCSMSFVTKDRLDVHVRTHNLSLTLTPTTPFKSVFVDETPTPTRFLKELETEVFQELGGVNPFDATFRKANSSNTGTFIIPESSSLLSSLPDTEVLNTPSITIPDTPTPLLLRTHFAKGKASQEVHPGSTDSLPFTPNLGLEGLETGSVFLAEEILPDVKTPSVQTPVITSIGHSSPLKVTTTGVPTAVVVSRPSAPPTQTFAPVTAENAGQPKVEPTQAVVQSVCVTPMVQVIIRLPDGQTMPVQFPVMAQGTASNVAAAPIAVTQASVPVSVPTVATAVHGFEPVPTSAKMKLKERLTSANKLKVHPSPPKSRTKPAVILLNDDALGDFGISPPSSPVLRPGHNGRKRRESSYNPDEKRKRSLERNRAAATRCREKKKVWITALEQKAEELENVNTNLQHEVSQLRNEVAQLKTMLLAHKDCPVTLQQKGMAFTDRKAYTAIQLINNPEDLQTVPNGSSLSSEFMEVELSCAQSSSSSENSDTSDASFKER